MREIDQYLLKLKFYKATEISEDEIDVNNLPENFIYNNSTGNYIKIENQDVTQEDIDRYLKVKNTYNFHIIKNCVLTCTIFFVIAVSLLIFSIII
jgi:hypothetical protein